MEQSTGASKLAIWTALGVVYVVWGSTYLAIRVLVRTAPPLLSAGARFLVAGLALGLIIGLRRGWRTLRVSWRELGGCALLGLLLPLGGNGLVTLAERDVASGIAALVVAVIPLYVVLIRAVTGDLPRPATLVGVLLGFAGIAVLADPHGGARLSGVALLLLASFFWSIGSWAQGRLPLPRDPFVVTAWEMATGGAAMVVVAFASGEPGDHPISGISTEGWLAWGYLAVFGSMLAFTAYVWVLHAAPISLVATYAYVNPAVAVLLGAVFLGEAVTSRVLIGGLVVLAAVAVVVGAESRSRRQAEITPAPEPVVAD